MKLKRLMMFFLLILVVFSVFIIPVEAKEQSYYCGFCRETHKGEFKDYITKNAYEMYDTVYGGNIFGDSTNEILKFNAGSVDDIPEGAVYNKNLLQSFKELWSKIKKPYNTIAQVGKILLMIFVMIQFLETTSIRNINVEDIFKMVLKVAIGIIVIDYGYDILSLILEISSSTFDSVFSGKIEIISQNAECMFYYLINKSWLDTWTIFLGLFPAWLVMQLAKAIVYIVAWSRILELCVRGMFAPIGMADIITQGIHGNGIKYLRKFFSCALQGAIILASTRIYSVVVNSVTVKPSLSVVDSFLHIALIFVLIVIVLRSKEYANNIAGV